jgi:adenylate cyclase
MRRLRQQTLQPAGAAGDHPLVSAVTRILVVEDDQASRGVLVDRLAARGYELLQAATADEALSIARRERPDLILLDVVLPGKDGLQVCRELKADATLPFTPVILVTGRSTTRDVVAGLEAGGDEYLTKPVDHSALLARVESMLRIKALHATVEQQRAQLQRFVSPQIAQLVVSASSDALLQSHRREIAVVCVRLTGFTSFCETAAPEDVMAVLHEFHAAMGELIVRFEGTFERFTGDGLKVFFNDPLPCPEPAVQAVRMALAMSSRSRSLSTCWQQRGHELGFSAAISMGFATLGVIGFAGRSDYAAVGLAADLASGLCASADADQVLATQRVVAAVGALMDVEDAGRVRLPQAAREIRAFRVLGVKSPVPATQMEPFAPLSPREHEVALLVSQGLTNRLIAERLVVTEATAAKHVENILNKLGFSSRAQIARWVVERS